MKRIFTILTFFQLLAPAASAQLLWKVTGKGIDNPSYILGTHHAVPFNFCDSIPGLMRAVEDVEWIIGEFDMMQMEQMTPAQMMEMQKLMMMPEDTTLASLFDENDQILLDKYLLETMGGNLQMFSSMKPMTLMVTLQNKILTDIIPDIARMTGMDKYLQNLGRTKGKQIGGLETMDYQLNLLYGSSLKDQAEALMEMVRKGNSKELLIELTEAYKTQDLKLLWKIFQEQMTPYEYEALVTVRNHNWIEQMVELIPAQSSLFVVGSGHLLGDDGLITLLKDRGFKVKPVKK
jgi:uncharacterized protein YbaP (TraB family)